MTAITNLPGATDQVLQSAISAYSQEAYMTANKLTGTGIVGSNPNINTNTETFIGQVRWHKPLAHVVNVASLTDSTAGSTTTSSADFLNYVKTVRSTGAENVNMKQVVTQEDGLARMAAGFSEIRAQDEHDAILAVLKGVAIAEALNGAATGSGGTGLGGQTFDNDPDEKKYGFYVDLGSNKAIVDATAIIQGAARADGFLQAVGKAYKDKEPDWMYMIASPEVIASLRSANLVDQTKVSDGNIEFSTIFNGKFRLIQTRASQGFATAERTMINTGAGVDITGTKTTFLVAPGAIAFQNLSVPMPTEIDRNASAYKGGGTTTVWSRWGFVAAPAGYDWDGESTVFATNDGYKSVQEGANQIALTAVTTIANARGTWVRKTKSALSLGILPVFHS